MKCNNRNKQNKLNNKFLKFYSINLIYFEDKLVILYFLQREALKSKDVKYLNSSNSKKSSDWFVLKGRVKL